MLPQTFKAELWSVKTQFHNNLIHNCMMIMMIMIKVHVVYKSKE